MPSFPSLLAENPAERRRLPQAWQTKRGAISESRTSSGHRSAGIATECEQWVVGAIDQDTSRATVGAHFAEGDLLLAHAAGFRGRRGSANYQSLGVRNGRELLRVGGVNESVSMMPSERRIGRRHRTKRKNAYGSFLFGNTSFDEGALKLRKTCLQQ